MATDLLTCCERLDESKYWHKCACPTATFECESDQYDYELDGLSEYVASQPPRKYLTETPSGSITDTAEGGVDGRTLESKPMGALNYVIGGSSIDTLFWRRILADEDGIIFTKDCGNGSCRAIKDSYGGCKYPSARRNCTPSSSADFFTPATFVETATTQTVTSPVVDEVGSYVATLSNEDTDQDAIDRAELDPPTDGTLCSSRWETRNTQFDWIKRKSEYIIECENLVIGVEYEVTPTIRRRTALDDGSGVWEEVIVDSEIFTATETTKTFPKVLLGEDENDEGEIIQGYEYEITGVHIEKTL